MFLPLSDSSDKIQGVRHLGIRVIIYQGGLIRVAPEGCSLHRHRSSAKR